MTPPSYRPARPLSPRERVELATLARSLDAVPRLRPDRRRRLGLAIGLLVAAVVVASALVGAAMLGGTAGFELAAVGLGTLLFAATLRDILRSSVSVEER